jgi:predicted nucleotidyltransferase
VADHLRKLESIGRYVARECASLPGVRASALFGSVATGEADPSSDVDVLVVCKPRVTPVRIRESLYRSFRGVQRLELDPRDPDSDPIFGGSDRLRLRDAVVHIELDTEERLRRIIDEINYRGALMVHGLPPRPWTLAAVLGADLIPVSDRYGVLKTFRKELGTCSATFARNAVRDFAPRLRSLVEEANELAHQGIGPSAFLFVVEQALDHYGVLLCILNGRYPAPTKRVQRLVQRLPQGPRNHAARLQRILQGPFTAAGMRRAATDLEQLARELLNHERLREFADNGTTFCPR